MGAGRVFFRAALAMLAGAATGLGDAFALNHILTEISLNYVYSGNAAKGFLKLFF